MSNMARLMAMDGEDLTVIAAMVQDAITRPDQMAFLKSVGKFTLTLSRFAWEIENVGPKAARHQRRQAVLSFNRVRSVRSTGIQMGSQQQVLSILAIRMMNDAAPGGTVEILFADGPVLHLDVECIEVQLADTGAAWDTRFKPRHPA